jgi:hypothetical protein
MPRLLAMNTRALFLATLVSLAPHLPAAAESGWVWQNDLIPDPGFDLDSAEVLRVTSLAGDGQGTLRDALRKSGPRLIVFEVGGVIDLGKRALNVREPRVFIAGQTAPGPGITIIRGGIAVEASHTVIQHLCVRPGDAGEATGSGWEPDGIATTGGPEDVWIDHCSITWSVDENLSATTWKSPTGRPSARIHFRNCLIAEGLDNSSHKKGPHSKGSLVYGGTQQVAIVGCLYSSNVERNPLFQPDTSGVIVNNLICNPGQRAIHFGAPDSKNGDSRRPPKVSVVGNVVWYGEHTKRSARAMIEGRATGFFQDNEGYDWFGKPLNLLRADFPGLEQPEVWPRGLEAKTTTAAVWHAARFAGARPARRDPIDQRIISSALSGTARIIDSQDEVGGYPQYEPASQAIEVPADNRRAWLDRLARQAIYGAEK